MAKTIVGGVVLLTCMDADPVVEENFFRGTEKQVLKAIHETVADYCREYLKVEDSDEDNLEYDPVNFWEESDDKCDKAIQIHYSLDIYDLPPEKEKRKKGVKKCQKK